jgi:hypothetical protein
VGNLAPATSFLCISYENLSLLLCGPKTNPCGRFPSPRRKRPGTVSAWRTARHLWLFDPFCCTFCLFLGRSQRKFVKNSPRLPARLPALPPACLPAGLRLLGRHNGPRHVSSECVKFCLHISILVKIRQKLMTVCMKTYLRFSAFFERKLRNIDRI